MGRKLWTVGSNADYVTGLGTNSGLSGPSAVQVGSADTWVDICVPWKNSSAVYGLRSDGTIWSWSLSTTYQSGQGTTTTIQNPTQIGSGTNWARLANGNSGNVGMGAFIKTDGTLWTVGSNAFGLTGQGTESGNTTSLTQVSSGTNWDQVSIGTVNAAGIRDGQLWLWGNRRMAGISSSSSNTTSPVQSGSDTNWEMVSSGEKYGLAIKNGGELWGWGNQEGGPILGDGTTTWRYTPVRIGSDSDWVFVRAGNAFGTSYGIKEDGTLWAWGNRTYYLTGSGSNTGTQSTPAQVGSATNWLSISHATTSVAGVRTNGDAYSWGYNSGYVNFQGLNTATYTTTPTIVGTGDVTDIFIGNGVGFALGNPQVAEDVAPDITAVSFTGNENQGQVLSGSVTESTGDPTPTMTYKWQRDTAGDNSFSDISGATSINYTLQSGDVGNQVRLQATATNSAGSDTMNSSASGLIGPPYSAPAISSASISGTAMENATLTASASGVTGVPTPTTSYQWQYNDGAGWTNTGTDSNTYTVPTARIGDDIRCVITVTSSEGTDSATSNTIGPILQEPVAPAITVISISGTAQEGETLTGSVTATGYPTPTISRFWQRWNGSTWNNIAGATGSTYTLVEADVGTAVRFGATATNSEGSDTDYSSGSGTVDPENEAPIISSVVVSGTAQEGETLTSSINYSVAGFPSPTVSRQWQYYDWTTGWEDISGETSSSITLGPSEVGFKIRLEVEASNISGSSLRRSAATAVVVPEFEAPVVSKPIISGIPQVGQELIASASATGYPVPAITWQWKRWNGATYDSIAGATSRIYIATLADLGTHLIVTATATSTEGTDSDDSDPTSTIVKTSASPDLYRFFLHTWDGTTLGELTNLRNVNLDFGISKNPSLTFDTLLDSPMGADLANNDYRVVTAYRWNPYTETWTLLFSGPIFTKEENGKDNTPTIGVTAVGPHWRLTKRICDDSTGAGRRQEGMSPTGNGLALVVSDFANYRVAIFNAKTGAHISNFGSFGTGNGQFNGPRGICSGPGGFIYVADSANDRIQKFTSSGTYVTKWGTSGTGDNNLDGPRGVAVDPAGNVWVTDRGNKRVMKYTDTGEFLLEVPATGSHTMNELDGISVDDDGFVYAADNESGKGFYKISQSGEILSSTAGPFRKVMRDALGQFYWTGTGGNARKSGRANLANWSSINSSGDAFDIDVADDGSIFVLESDGSAVSEVKKYTADGTVSRTIGDFGSGSGETDDAKSIALVRTGGKDAVEIVSDLIDNTNTIDGNCWIRSADPQGEGAEVFIPKKSWGGFKKISAALEELQSGFEWEIRPYLATDGGGLVLGEFYGNSTIGEDISDLVGFEYGAGRMNADEYSIKTSLENLVTRASYPAADARPYAVSSEAAAAVSELGIFEEVAEGGVITAALRRKIINLYLRLGSFPRTLVEITPARSDQTGPRNTRVPIPMIDYKPGDTVGVHIQDNGSDRLPAGAARVYDIQISLDETAKETATINLYSD
jgi:alpha-tubulin suppressor-like RCC1 family protein